MYTLNMRNCWCGNTQLQFFSEDYSLCASCQTLISKKGLSDEEVRVENDNEYYGKDYWLTHQSNDFEYPNIFERARLDIPERCAHWLNIILKYKLPKAKTLELGCAHGALVAMMQAAGYEASGLELSPWIAQFAQETFGINVLKGPIEEQKIEQESLDIIILMDVLEHFPDPVSTMQKCLSLLKPDGIFVIQTPDYPIDMSYSCMLKNNHPFLLQLKEKEHLYLFGTNSVRAFFNKIGIPFINFERAIFSHYDMFFVASKSPLTVHSDEAIEEALSKDLQSRLISAILRANKKSTMLEDMINKR